MTNMIKLPDMMNPKFLDVWCSVYILSLVFRWYLCIYVQTEELHLIWFGFESHFKLKTITFAFQCGI